MEDDQFRRRLIRFYEVHNPSCLSSVDAIWQTYRGREEDIFRVLTDKYGPEPVLEEENGESLRTQVRGSNSSIDGLSIPQKNLHLQNQFKERPESSQNLKDFALPKAESPLALNLMDVNEAKRVHYPQPTTTKTEKSRNLREKLIEFYQQYNKSMVPFVDEVIENYNDNEGHMFEDLKRQYKDSMDLVLPVSSSSKEDLNAVMKRLSDALETKTAETLAIKKDKEHLVKELTAANKLLEASQLNEKHLKTQLLAAKEQLQGCHGSAELEVKNAEVVALQKDKENLAKELAMTNKLLESAQEKEKLLRSQLLATEEILRSREEIISNDARQRDKEQIRENSLQAELSSLRKECSGLRSSVFNSGNRIRVLEVEKKQLLEELKEAEKRIIDVGDMLSKEHQKNLSLLEEVGRLRLSTGGALSEAAFTSIVNDIEKQFSEHYEKKLGQCREEMNDYYVYAENQLRRRDALIAELSNNL
ncbi:hypothetical protein C3747_44g2 [Trypanosoma cruzi]|uniref:Uncharacterized protein n=2 Tax=Trypanosoma cruzi TaxID=5693 RepID=Q4CYV0_TRYCC|nr:hypothetical protein, conserved [Trypanosoma cruzi]EAN85454.1 hypothetical protein, conserved [Trypanosoma cruzi]KAF8302859.1 hypothetical protein TcYC6_0044480 [Trypanosoma cruzi]PWV13212.1 hypothetical protein C3747_44g2 [Trypanosoma cruzi]RNC61019.1 hypothetical protein TcCL_ESM01253 [Trypanosoma cruzi]|eukprot:XP_807305.1 hypothetical protein [Trypanosoma cruzi strain CL Brener]